VVGENEEPREDLFAGLFIFTYHLTPSTYRTTYFSRTSDIAIPFDCVLHFTEPTCPAAMLKRT